MEDVIGVKGTKQLSEVVKECVSRWFQETLKEAKAGDIKMQVLVSQMYFNGYGVSKDPQKGKFWMKKASKYIPSVLAVSEKRPGYGASDSDSVESATSLKLYLNWTVNREVKTEAIYI